MIDPSLPVDEVARRLLGARLGSMVGGELTAVELTEIEAYGGEDDPASHAYRGRTPRNESMFGPAGTIYVYRSYGVHWCMNIVTGLPGRGEAVLLRGGRPVAGEAVMARRRRRATNLADGPGKLTQALGISAAHDGLRLGSTDLVSLDLPVRPVGTILATPRVGISQEVGRPWRFVLAG